MAATCIHGGAECRGCMGCAEREMHFKCPNCGAKLHYDDTIYCDDNGIVGCQYCMIAIAIEDTEENCETI